jgi:hypothetical protein
MFVSKATRPKANKLHRCTYCGEVINPGEVYNKYKSVEDSWFTNKLHDECLAALDEECRYYGENEYTPFEGTRPGLHV